MPIGPTATQVPVNLVFIRSSGIEIAGQPSCLQIPISYREWDVTMDLPIDFTSAWRYAFAGVTILLAFVAAGHAVMYKRDSRAAVLWVGVIWLVPILGAGLYFLLGVNRIRRRAISIREGVERFQSLVKVPGQRAHLARIPALPIEMQHLDSLIILGDKVVGRPLLAGNKIEPLANGDIAYPAMLEAIRQAERTVSLSTYIFDNDSAGRAFSDELANAVQRGVQVRVLIDDAGARYSFPSIIRRLRAARIPVARFLPAFSLWQFVSLNLRTHRKILVADGRIGFTGGMNIREGHVLGDRPRHPVQDLHFRVDGPVVSHLQEAFADDWHFCVGELLHGEDWFPRLNAMGSVAARGISDGPDEDFEILRLVILGALACAKSSIRLVTPYFLPDQSIISALNVAAMRGVTVDIILPSVSNLPYIDWASTAHWWQLLQRDCRIWLTPPPFDHSKLLLVDDAWSLIGSANVDPRSLRLNFEFNVESYDAQLASALTTIVQSKLERARRVTLEEVDARPFPIRLRDGIARLFTPFL